MADTSNLSQFLTDVADAIREKKGTTDAIAAADFDTEIASIEGGSSGPMTEEEYANALRISNDILGLYENFTIMKYIESTGEQFIDTGVNFPALYQISNQIGKSYYFDITFECNDLANVAFIFGAYSSDQLLYRLFNLGGTSIIDYSHTSRRYEGPAFQTNKIYNWRCTNQYVIDLDTNENIMGPFTAYNSSFASILTENICVFTDHKDLVTGSNEHPRSAMKLYSFKIHNGATFVRDFIPAKDSDGVVCLYDQISGGFFYNQGEGEFTAKKRDEQFTRLSYIESTGEQYIDTGLHTSSWQNGVSYNNAGNFYMDIKFEWTDDTKQGYIFGATMSNDKYKYRLYKSTSNNLVFQCSEATHNIESLQTGKIYNVRLGNQYITDLDTDTVLAGSIQTGYPSYINSMINDYFRVFTSSASYTKATMKLYSLTIFNGQDVVRDFVPCKKPDGIVCLYDNVTETYFYNAGTGDFIAGEEV